MEILTDIPFELNFAALAQPLRVERHTPDAEKLADLIAQAQTIGKPKAVYAEAYIEDRKDESVTIGAETFTSRVLCKNLDGIGRVFAFVTTCGTELDRIELPADDLLQQYWLDSIKAALLTSARIYLKEHLVKKYALGKTASMAPGSGDVTVWPIEQQKQLFALLGDIKGTIGVELTESCLMLPNKSLSGIRFATEIDFRSCQLCHRPKCPDRSAAFDQQLWQSIKHKDQQQPTR